MRARIRDLLITGLGYCCPWAFFRVMHARASVIADRLGVTKRGVNNWKRRYKAGELRCEGCTGCLQAHIRSLHRRG